MADRTPRFRRRKTARPGEIVAAALDVFAEKGFAAARLDEIAARAGVSKGALYLYFETKDDLFRAVVRETASPNLEAVRAVAESYRGPLADLAPLLLARAAAMLEGDPRLPAVARMVIGESRAFPDLAQTWHDTVVAPALAIIAGAIARAQAGGEVRPGDARLLAFSLVGPMLMGVLFDEVFAAAGAQPVELGALAAQHARTVLHGMLATPGAAR